MGRAGSRRASDSKDAAVVEADRSEFVAVRGGAAVSCGFGARCITVSPDVAVRRCIAIQIPVEHDRPLGFRASATLIGALWSTGRAAAVLGGTERLGITGRRAGECERLQAANDPSVARACQRSRVARAGLRCRDGSVLCTRAIRVDVVRDETSAQDIGPPGAVHVRGVGRWQSSPAVCRFARHGSVGNLLYGQADARSPVAAPGSHRRGRWVSRQQTLKLGMGAHVGRDE